MSYGMIGYVVPHSLYPKGYQCNPGKKLDMGGGCVRFRKLEDVPLEVIGQFVASLPVDVYIGRIGKVFAEIAEARAAKKTAKAKLSKRKPTKKKAAK